MKNNRRDFLKLTGLAGLGVAGSSVLSAYAIEQTGDTIKQFSAPRKQLFNMSGYGAPKLDTVRAGFIGLGQRGPEHLSNLSKLEGVEIKALCDLRPESVAKANKTLTGNHNPTLYSGGTDEWKKLCEQKDIDVIYIATPWHLHTPMAVYAMEHGKHVAVEVPAAVTLAECWKLVETSERTKKHCMMLENCCYDFFELLTLNMARQGYFGDIIHGEGAYIHNLMELNFRKDAGYQDMWRLKENANRKGDLYPTHGLGPICQVMNINRGDKMEYLVSLQGNDFMMGNMAKQLASTDDFFKPYANKSFNGNMTTTMVRTNKGRTIMLQHDVTSPRIYSRLHLVSGTKGTAMKYPLPGKISISHQRWLNDADYKAAEAKYTPNIVKRVGELAKEVGGHGGMDFLMDWRTIDLLRNGLPLEQDVYDAALWSSISPLSEWSVKNRSNSIDVPDFTGGSWQKNTPVDIEMTQGGTTKPKL